MQIHQSSTARERKFTKGIVRSAETASVYICVCVCGVGGVVCGVWWLGAYLFELFIRQSSVSVGIEVVQEISQYFLLCLLSLLNSGMLSGIVDQLDVFHVDNAVTGFVKFAKSALHQLLTSIVHISLEQHTIVSSYHPCDR